MVREVGKKYPLTYEAVEYDPEGWASTNKVNPLPFDITLCKVERQGKILNKYLPGWWTGKKWEGRMLKSDDKVINWKKNLGEFEHNGN